MRQPCSSCAPVRFFVHYLSSTYFNYADLTQVERWRPEDVGNWIRSLLLQQYAAAFVDALVDGVWLSVGLSDEDLIDLGVTSSLHRKKIKLHLAKIAKPLSKRPPTKPPSTSSDTARGLSLN